MCYCVVKSFFSSTNVFLESGEGMHHDVAIAWCLHQLMSPYKVL